MPIPCPTCGHLVADASRFCAVCGSPVLPGGGAPISGPPGALGPRCRQPVGVLVPHRCGQPARGSCRVCGQPFCDQHLTIDPQGAICAACASGASSGGADSLGSADSLDSADLDYFDRVSESERGEDFTDLS